jgi:hypothetical protein
MFKSQHPPANEGRRKSVERVQVKNSTFMFHIEVALSSTTPPVLPSIQREGRLRKKRLVDGGPTYCILRSGGSISED